MSKMIKFIVLLLTIGHAQICASIRLNKKNLNTLNSLNGLISPPIAHPNLTSISFSAKIVDKNSSSTDDPFLIDVDLLPTQNTNSKKLYTIKKPANSTANDDTLTKYKRNNTERSAARHSDSVNFQTFDCEPCTNRGGDTNCTNSDNQTCGVYFKCSNSSVNSSDDHSSDGQLIGPMLIEKRYYCDGLCDCGQCEDEIRCSLGKCDRPNEIMCQDESHCIEPKQICDSFFNCRDHSDEIGCFDSRGCLAAGRFACDNQCLERALVCDGLMEDCMEKSDEENCECNVDEFRCFNGQCIKKSLRCDYVDDCSDGSDEWSCVLIDERDIVLKILPDLTHGVLCAESNFSMHDADEICRLVGKESTEFSQIEIELVNSTRVQWVNKRSFWKLHWDLAKATYAQFNETTSQFVNRTAKSTANRTDDRPHHRADTACKDNLAQTVTCKRFNCSSIHHDFNDFNNLTAKHHRHIGTAREIESMVRLQLKRFDATSNTTKLIECYAQIISPWWLLSSYSCLNSFLAYDDLRLSEIVLNHNQDLASKIKRIILHPRSSIYRSMWIRNFDLALGELDRPIVFEEKAANAICLPQHDIDVDITCFLTNFNDSEPIPFLVVDRDRCNEHRHFNNTVFKDNLCTIRQTDHEEDRSPVLHNTTVNLSLLKKRTNAHDLNLPAGSPLICLNSDSKWFLAGFLGYFDERNNLEHPTIFSNVFRMLDFITRVTGLESVVGSS